MQHPSFLCGYFYECGSEENQWLATTVTSGHRRVGDVKKQAYSSRKAATSAQRPEGGAPEKKRVRFSEREPSRVRVVVGLTELAGGHGELFYSKQETEMLYASSACSAMRVRMCHSKGERAPLGHEILGLEKVLTDDLEREYRRRRIEVRGAVCAEQQRRRGSLLPPDPDGLASTSRHLSRWAREMAHASALMLEKELADLSPRPGGSEFRVNAASLKPSLYADEGVSTEGGHSI